MDGTLAGLFLLVGLTDMGFNHCPDGCLARAPAQASFSLSAGDVIFQESHIDREAYLRYSFGHSFGPFQPAVGVSVTDSGDAWVGFGATHESNFWNDRGYVSLSLMPGVYARGDGPDLGHEIEFRSGIELGYRAQSGVRVGLVYDHRSNAEIASHNPGLETIQLRVSIPVR